MGSLGAIESVGVLALLRLLMAGVRVGIWNLSWLAHEGYHIALDE